VARRDRKREEIDNAETSLVIFEGLFGATRERLADDACGLVSAGGLHGSFSGHDRFNDAKLWAAHYRGPDFCTDLAQMHAAEDRLAERRWHRAYAVALACAVCPNYRGLTTDQEVLDFWFALAHATAAQRARAAAHVIREEERHG
jgi:hypothetical protein